MELGAIDAGEVAAVVGEGGVCVSALLSNDWTSWMLVLGEREWVKVDCCSTIGPDCFKYPSKI